ncbi:hypothetical protein H5410_033565 [Solanum commersonii]|uniref:Uncharacterized protein n=1 Tax=Solanum commersonii TaxID=4109 RepID=A0A9J5YN75_SOLCO|nr:hypothetical protein H5410_033565 [Solanum commersonii]
MTVGFSRVHRKRRRGFWIWWQLVVLLFVWFGGVSGGCGSGLVSPEMSGVLDWGFAGDEGGFGTGGYESI